MSLLAPQKETLHVSSADWHKRSSVDALRPTGWAGAWLISPAVDLAAFAGSALVSLLLLWIGAANHLLEADTPDWTWMTLILLVDVAHVYATAFRVYFDKAEFGRRPWLFVLTPILAWLIGTALYSEGDLLFWRVLAYLAVFHFVRQQYGWVALYRAKAGQRGRLNRSIDNAAIYAATLYPLLYWHAHLPRHFWWFVEDDFSTLPATLATIAAPLYWASLAAYASRTCYLAIVKRRIDLGKDVVVLTTAACWYLGIVVFNSDYAFTVTNVIIHGVPYLVFVFWYWTNRQAAPVQSNVKTDTGWPGLDRREAPGGAPGASQSLQPRPPISLSRFETAFRRDRKWRSLVVFVAIVWLFAFVEELLWDRGVWHDRPWLFGSGWDLPGWKTAVVPLLAVPQMTHYLLDGFIWRRRSNPRVSGMTEPKGQFSSQNTALESTT